MPDTCWCKHVKDTHKVEVRSGKVWLGECMSCSCAKFAETRPLLVLPPKTPVAVAPETAPVVEQPVPVEEVVPDGRRLIEVMPERVEGPAPAAVEEAPAIPPDSLLWFYNAFWCQCGSRAFEQRQCCGSPMRPVRVEIHTREVSDG
jgi:hypothetical protein